MAGSVFFLVIAIVIAALAVFAVISPLWLALAAAFVAAWIVAGGALAKLFSGRSTGPDPASPEAGVPTTQEATYDPVQQP